MKLINKYSYEIKRLREFKELFIEYSNLDTETRLPANQHIRKDELRRILNSINSEVRTYVNNSGEASYIYYSPPPAIGGITGNIDFFSNLFNLKQFSIPRRTVIDTLDKSIGNYEFYQHQYKSNLINPFYLIGGIIRIPFKIIQFSGFNSSKLELSFIGKIYKFLSATILLLVTILTALSLLGIDTKVYTNNNTVDTQSKSQCQQGNSLEKDQEQTHKQQTHIKKQK